MGLQKFLAGQLRKPTGWFGSLVLSRVMNRVNLKVADAALSLLDIQPEDWVLEIGFGGGMGLARVADRLTTGTITGVDLSTEMLHQAERRFRSEIANGRVRVMFGDIAHLPFPDGSFDRVFTVNTIYFWPETLPGLAEIRRVLREGGRTAIGLRSREKMEGKGVTKYDFRLFAPGEVVDAMQTAGFHDVRLHHRDLDKVWDVVVVAGTR